MKDDQNVYVDWMAKYGGFFKDMTLRDYFAAAFVSSGHVFKSEVPVNIPELVAAQAYQLADAMLEARK
jgi:hypothetical protein